MNAMAVMAARENAAVKQAWQGEIMAELPKLPVGQGQAMRKILKAACKDAGFISADILLLKGKISGFKARARMQAIREMSANGHSNRAICDFLGMKIRSVQNVVRTVTHKHT